ncbi:MAG: hypothetical protein C4540_02505 [Candidatus Omnitrophota bacterium]|jgi:hypothetical protein|nr:MAG: hypothetical protein C4540_02505 [Candidatus Omnitrophota bacterium]
MTAEIGLLLAGAIGIFCAGYGISALRGKWGALVGRVDRLESDLAEAKSQIGRQRHTHSTIAGIEDSTANLVQLMIELDTSRARLDTIMRKLHLLREGPNAYPREDNDV